MNCQFCFVSLSGKTATATARCSHQDHYNKVRQFIESDDKIVIVDRGLGFEEYDYEVGRASRGSQLSDRCGITHFSEAHKVYGSEVVASCLIHELGHCQQFRQGKTRPAGQQQNIKYEEEANELGLQAIPNTLVPADYREHRAFFLKSYLDTEAWNREGWKREKTLSEWESFRKTLENTPVPV